MLRFFFCDMNSVNISHDCWHCMLVQHKWHVAFNCDIGQVFIVDYSIKQAISSLRRKLAGRVQVTDRCVRVRVRWVQPGSLHRPKFQGPDFMVIQWMVVFKYLLLKTVLNWHYALHESAIHVTFLMNNRIKSFLFN